MLFGTSGPFTHYGLYSQQVLVGYGMKSLSLNPYKETQEIITKVNPQFPKLGRGRRQLDLCPSRLTFLLGVLLATSAPITLNSGAAPPLCSGLIVCSQPLWFPEAKLDPSGKQDSTGSLGLAKGK